MTRISPLPHTSLHHDDEAAIARSVSPKFKWQMALIWLLRIAACICMVRGLNYWAELLGLLGTDFDDRAHVQQIAVVCFASAYCFASVGLWMVASWGAALWILALVGEGTLLILEPKMHIHFDPLNLGFKLGSPLYLSIGIVGVAMYMFISWLAQREKSQEHYKR